MKQSDFSKLEWIKDDNTRICWSCGKGEPLTKTCSKCELSKERSFFKKKEFSCEKSRCSECMKVLQDAKKEENDATYAGLKAAKLELKANMEDVEVKVKKLKIKKPE